MRQEAKIITNDSGMRDILRKAEQIAAAKASVLIRGPGGSGKHAMAEFVHSKSPRSRGDMVVVSGTAPGDIGSAFNKASGSTLIIDEVDTLEPKYQIQLLGILQSNNHDARVVSLTTENLEEAVSSGRFRRDLYFLLKVIEIEIPPLSERKGDIPLLANYFLEFHSRNNALQTPTLDEHAVNRLLSHDWDGNIRELSSVIERAVVTCSSGEFSSEAPVIRGEKIELETANHVSLDGGSSIRRLPDGWVGRQLADIEREMIYWTLQRTNGNRTHAARMLGISIRTLRNKLSQYRQEEDMLFTNI